MFQLGKTLVSESILEKEFVCNLSACKGICCVDGDAGAPLDKEEVVILEEIYPKVKRYMTAEGIAAVESQGTSIVSDEDKDLETPLINGKACAYINYDEKGVAKCAIEDAYNQGEVDWKKPVSCHLYPVRVREYTEFSAVNYHSWGICDDACSLGEELGIPVYKFVKEALIRKFGEDWYAELEKVGADLNNKNTK